MRWKWMSLVALGAAVALTSSIGHASSGAPDLDQQTATVQGQPTIRSQIMKIYHVPGGNAAEVAATLQEAYKSIPSVKIRAAGNNAIIVLAHPDDHARIWLVAPPPPKRRTKAESIDAGEEGANKLADRLRCKFDSLKAGGLSVEADADNNAVILYGPIELVDQAMEKLRK
jgi:hypothetical protein